MLTCSLAIACLWTILDNFLDNSFFLSLCHFSFQLPSIKTAVFCGYWLPLTVVQYLSWGNLRSSIAIQAQKEINSLSLDQYAPFTDWAKRVRNVILCTAGAALKSSGQVLEFTIALVTLF